MKMSFCCYQNSLLRKSIQLTPYEVGQMQLPLQASLQLPISQTGKCNAIAFWFELELDEETQLSTSPYCQKVVQSAVLVLYAHLFASASAVSLLPSVCPLQCSESLHPACGRKISILLWN